MRILDVNSVLFFRKEKQQSEHTLTGGGDAPHSGVCIAFTDNMEQVKGHVHFHNQLSSASECTKMKDKATLQIDFLKKKKKKIIPFCVYSCLANW